MAYSVTCPHCENLMQVEDSLAGQQVYCPICAKILMAPGPGEPAASGTPPVTPGPLPVTPGHRTYRRGLGIASMVLGILGFCSGGLLGLVALILGIVVLVKASSTPDIDRGRGFAIAGIATGACSLLVAGPLLIAILLPSLARARDLSKRAVCAANVRAIGTSLQAYADQHGGQYPQQVTELVGSGLLPANLLVCPAVEPGVPKKHYHYVGPCPDAMSDRVLIYEDRANHSLEGGHVYWCDGTTRFVTEGEWDSVVQEEP